MKKILVVSAIFVAALGTLLWVGVASAIPDLSVAEVLESPLVNGAQPGDASPCQVKDGKVLAIESIAPLRFSVASRHDPTRVLAVTSDRSVPDNFRVGIDVGLRGTYRPQKGVFEAYRVTTKCPSKYEASKDSSMGGYAEPQAGPASGPEAPTAVPPGATRSSPGDPAAPVSTTSQSTAQS